MDELLKLNGELIQYNEQVNLKAFEEKTMMLLRAIKSGRITIDQFALVGGGWELCLPPAFTVKQESMLPEGLPAESA